MGEQYSVTELKKKKDSLMASFRACVNKVKQSMKSGAGTDEVYKPTWFAYEKMLSFLRDKDMPRNTRSTEDIMPEGDSINEVNDNSVAVSPEDGVELRPSIENNALVLPSTSTFQGPARKRNKVLEGEEIKDKMCKAYSILAGANKRVKEKTICSIYGELVAAKLEAMDEQARDICMHRLDNILNCMNCTTNIRQMNMPPQSSPSPHSQSSISSYHPTTNIRQMNMPPQSSPSPSSQSDIPDNITNTPYNQHQGTVTLFDNEDTQPLASFYRTFK